MSKEDSKIDAGAILEKLRSDMVYGSFKFGAFDEDLNRVPFTIKTTEHLDTIIPLLAIGKCKGNLPHDPFITFIDSCQIKGKSFSPLDVVSDFFQRCVSMPRVMTDKEFDSICEKECRAFIDKFKLVKDDALIDYTDFGWSFTVLDYLDRFLDNRYICSIYLCKMEIADMINPVIEFGIYDSNKVKLFAFGVMNITKLYMQINHCQSYGDPLLIDIPEKLHKNEYMDYFR